MIDESGGVRGFGIHPIPSDDVIKQAKLNNIKTRAGKIAYLKLLGGKAEPGNVSEGIKRAEGALKWVAKMLEERTSG